MRKARLGFEIYSLDNELLVEEDKDFVRREKDKVWASMVKSKARKLKCYYKHREQYNAQRRAKAATIRGRFEASKTKAIKVGQKWKLTQEEWESIWIGAGWVILPGTIDISNPNGDMRTAYMLRGPSKLDNTMMQRKDLGGPWSVDNCYISFQGTPLEGSIYHHV